MPKNNTKHASRKALQPESVKLTDPEIERLAEKLAVSLEHDPEDMSLLLLLINHLEASRDDFLAFSTATFVIKKKFFAGTMAAEEAQERFEAQAVAARGSLLLWPTERAAVA